MTRNPSISDSVKSASSRASELSILSDEECKRILSVIERDFELRQKEHNRLQELQKLKRAEADRAEYLANSKEFNAEHCIRCFKAFQFLINPKETCTICGLYVCHACASQVPPKKTWACKACIKLKELEALTSTWFYTQTGSKHKRCGSAKVIRELHKREREFADLDELDEFLDDDISTKQGGSVVSYVNYDKNVKRELNEYSTRLSALIDKLEADLAERNTHNNHRTVRGKISTIVRRGGRESLKALQQEITTEIGRARVAISGPLRRSNTKGYATHERDLENLLVQQTEEVLQTNLQNFRKTLTAPNSSINANNFDPKLAQAIFDKCVSKEIFQELPDVIDSSAPVQKSQRQSSNSSSLTSLTKPSSFQPTWSNSSPRTSSASWEIKSRNDNIRKISIRKDSIVTEEDTEKGQDDEEREQTTNDTNKNQPVTTTESIEFGNGLKLDLSSIDDDTSNTKTNRHSIDSDYDAINRSISRVGDWQTNFTLVESKQSSHSGEETPRSTRSNRDAVFLTIPKSDNKYTSPRIGDKPLEDLADDDLYADESSSSYAIPINTTTIGDHSQISENESTNIRKLFPLPANLLLQNHSSCSFRRPSYTYESDNESITSSAPSLTEMKAFIDEEKFRMDPNVKDPKFILRPKDTTARCGETAKFKTKVSGTEPVDVFWFRFGTDDELVNDEKYQLSYDDTYHYLKIYSTNKNDQGAYLCVIANDKAQNVDMVKLFIKDNKRTFDPPRVLQKFLDTDVIEGSSLTLKCKLDQGYPKARVLWYKENTLIQPNGHYKLYYYGNGQHALHADEATIEDDNGTFTCLALNAAGRVQITADVFVHEKEVIDIPRDSPIVTSHPRISRKKKGSKNISNMNHNDDDENNPPTISPPLSPLTRNVQSDSEEQQNAKRFMDKFKTDRSTKLLENWRDHREASVPASKSDTNELKSLTQQPFYLNRPLHIEQDAKENPRSPVLQPQSDSNATKPKWAIRLPELLNSTVGPDRQKRDPSRRHTTNVILQQEQEQPLAKVPQSKKVNPLPLPQSLSSSQMSNNVEDDRPSTPLVKQLKQKFDRMTASNLTTEQNRAQSQSQSGLSKIPRDDYNNRTGRDDDNEVASLTCRGLTTNNGERPTQKARPMLPIRPSTQTASAIQNSKPSRSDDDNIEKIHVQLERGE